MIISVNSKNEFKFFPKIGAENDNRPDGEKFTVILKRMSTVLHSSGWAKINPESGDVSIDIPARVKEHIIRLENAPKLEDENGKKWDMTMLDLTGGAYPDLYPILSQVNDEINRLDEVGGVEEKKY